ncbi:MAG: gliding motility protein GldN [Flavobacteriales bacterium]|jgi:gliding motility associated protien GldN
MKKIILTAVLLPMMLCLVNFAGAQTQTVLDGAYVPEHNPTRRVVPYPHLRQADVMWRKRVWEMIDVRQKINHSLYFPLEEIEDRKSLFDVIRTGLLDDGSITCYSLGPTQEDDEFRYPFDATEVDSLLNPEVVRYVEDLDTGEKVEKRVKEPITSEKIVAYKLKEDWIFDKQRSERYVRIIGIAPVVEKKSESGEVIGKKELFWLYFPECRYIFANADVFNLHNDAQRMTFDDLFYKRMFHGYIIKEENVYNRSIESYAKGLDALMESERIKEEIFLTEHDLWHY